MSFRIINFGVEGQSKCNGPRKYRVLSLDGGGP